MRRFAVLFFIVTTVCLVTGCSSKYAIYVNGYLDSGNTQQITSGACVYVVESKDQQNPLFVTEVRRKIETLLRLKGYSICPAESADYQLAFRYGIDSGKQIERDQLMHEPGHYARIRTHDGNGSDSYSTVYLPGQSYWITHSETVYTSWLSFSLYDKEATQKESEAPRPLWVGEITSSGLSSDLREVIDPMLVCAFEHFGQNTRRQVREIVPKNDPRIPIVISN